MSQVQVDLTVIIYGNLIIKRCATKKNNVEHIDDNLSNVLEKSRITVKSTQTLLIKMTKNCQLNLFIEINPNFTVMCILVRTASFPRFWRNHPLCRKEWYLIWKGCLFSLRWRKMMFFWGSHFEFFFTASQWKKQPVYMKHLFFLHYWCFFQNLWKEAVQTFMQTTVHSKKIQKIKKYLCGYTGLPKVVGHIVYLNCGSWQQNPINHYLGQTSISLTGGSL